MMNKLYKITGIMLLLLFCTGVAIQAQNKIIIRGQVKSTIEKEPLIGVSVVEMDKENRYIRGTQTDLDGNFSLTVDNVSGRKLVVSYIGYKTQTVPIGNQAVLNISLDETAHELGEVVVTAQKQVNTGLFNMNERDMTYAYSKVDASELSGLPVASIDEALQGRMAGVDIVASSGDPGAGMSIRIRGTTSINSSSDPLIVVNGVPYETQIGTDFDFATADEESYSQLLNISPSDIETIVVLKDAASCAMYGNKGANGVLLITTKKGVMGAPRLNYSFKGSASSPRDPIPTLTGDEYTTMILEAAMNAGTPLNFASYPEFARDPNNPYYYYNYGQNTDWVDALTQTGFTQDHNLSLTGGGSKAQYRASVGYYDQKGTVVGTAFQRISAGLNLNYSISDKLWVSADIRFTHGERDGNYMSDLLNTAYTKMPNQSIYEYTVDGIQTPVYFSPESTPQGNFNSADMKKYKGGIYNPVAMANEGVSSSVSDRVIPLFNLQYRFWEDRLTYKGTVSFDIASEKNKKFLPQIATGRPWTETNVNRANDSDTESFNVYTSNMLQFNHYLNKDNNINLVGQVITQDVRNESYGVVTTNTPSSGLQDPSSPSRLLSMSSGSSQSRNVSMMIMGQYSLLDRYIINGVLRMDGDSKFSAKHRYGYFPSVSARWRLSGEPFMKNLTFINDLSLRASYGENGNAPSKNYTFYSSYDTYGYTYLGEQGVYPSSMTLEDLRWERISEFNAGLNFIAFNNRLNIDFEWYQKRSNDLRWDDVAISGISGYSQITMNVGTMDNRGWEFNMRGTPFKNKDWQVDFSVNFARNQNMIRSLSDNIPMEDTPTDVNGKYLSRKQIGNPIGSFYGYRYDGVYLNQNQTIAKDKTGNPIYTYNEKGERIPVYMKFWYPTNGYEFQAGDARYVDINNDGNIDYMDIVYLGDSNPLFTGGFGPSLKYKNWSLDAYFYFRYGNEIINQTKMNMENMNGFDNQSKATLKRWTHSYEDEASAPSDLIPRALLKKGYNYLGSDRYVEDGSFLRFKSLTFKYNFDKKLVNKIGLENLNLFATFYNLYIWTNYTGMDPEVSIKTKEGTMMGYDESRAPAPREYTFGLNVTF